ncbi:IclR family transcriptional regulator [Rathayibacter tanaceti]|uniref:Helix-turn-helix domain-containing protein n=2 Tax=Rathayibacter tanaceti TaxID=1671680 RepID=A0A162IZJ9_9MICO|nr:IclR family transcriptional regulator [Rathayibacter tanaceti]KZX20067.1 Pectin degradation repressor protein KdgR [Rathayibacter tanaceti]QHC56625.1 helix-turn-helix domain-containing protein [Rathayibacter tanaceti]TCO36233.1 IclR family transcriptional regulator [Rathayibacter tanaceti]
MSSITSPVSLGAPTAAETAAPAAFRAIQVLEVMSRSRGPLSLTDIAARAPLAKSSVHNLLTTLEAAGMVRRSGGGWVLAYKALEIGQSVLTSTDLVGEFRRTAAQYGVLGRETVLLAVLDGLDVLYLARHDGHQPVRLASDIGRKLPAVVTALGKAMLAGLPDADLDERLSTITELPRPTRASHRTVSELLGDLMRVRQQGYAVDAEENTIGVTCFSVPIPGAAQPTAISTTLLTQRLTPELRDALVRELTALAHSLRLFART